MDPSDQNNNEASRVYDPVRDVFTTLEPTNSIKSVVDPKAQTFDGLDDVFDGPVYHPVANAHDNQVYNPFGNAFNSPVNNTSDASDGQVHTPVGNAFHGQVHNGNAQAGTSTNPTKKCCRCRNQTTNPKLCNECCAKLVAERKAWISEGICSRCGKNPGRQEADGTKRKRCDECLEKGRKDGAEYRERMNAAKALMKLSQS